MLRPPVLTTLPGANQRFERTASNVSRIFQFAYLFSFCPSSLSESKTGSGFGSENRTFFDGHLHPKQLKMGETQRLTTGFRAVGMVRLGAMGKQAMKAFQIESETNQAPLATGRRHAAQRKLTEAQHLFNVANNRFDGRFS